MTPGSPPPPPGLQAERTELAWVRTALSGAGLALVAARVGPDPASFTVALVTGAAVIALGFAACLLRTRSLASRTPSDHGGPRRGGPPGGLRGPGRGGDPGPAPPLTGAATGLGLSP